MYLLSNLIKGEIRPRERRSQPEPHEHPSRLDYADGNRAIQFNALLAKPQAGRREYPEDYVIAGMRKTQVSMRKVPGHLIMGAKLGTLLRDMVNTVPTLKDMLIKAIARQPYGHAKLEQLVNDARRVVATALGLQDVEEAIKPVDNETCSTCVRATLLKTWATKAQDPAAKAVDWLFSGAPAGITSYDDELFDKLWPRKDDDDNEDHDIDTITTDVDHHDPNMQSSEINDNIWSQVSSFKVHDDDVLELIETYEEKKYVKVVDSVEQLHQEVGTGVTYSDLLAITKQRFDPEANSYKKKTRTVLNLKTLGDIQEDVLATQGRPSTSD